VGMCRPPAGRLRQWRYERKAGLIKSLGARTIGENKEAELTTGALIHARMGAHSRGSRHYEAEVSAAYGSD
jgi:hypothetical protein